MAIPNCCFMIIAGTFFSPANRRRDLYETTYLGWKVQNLIESCFSLRSKQIFEFPTFFRTPIYLNIKNKYKTSKFGLIKEAQLIYPHC